jgi:pSer/pThr/pTyr-binding forkhead associated (FHA) protein
MSYGRLEVYWPDGLTQSFDLQKSPVAIGRSVGNDIVLDTNSISRYHITLTRSDQGVVLTDLESVNGTYVDGRRVRPTEPITLRGNEEIQLGDLRLNFIPSGDTAKTGLDETRRITTAQPDFRVELDDPGMSVTPGAHVQVLLNIFNIGKQIERYSVQVLGLPLDWVRLDRVETEIAPDDRSLIVISVKPTRRFDAMPGDYPVTVRVRSKSTGEDCDAKMTLRVLSFSGFGIAMTTPRVDSNTQFEVHVHNQGSAPLALAMSGASPTNNLTFDIQPDSLTLAPGERQIVRGTVRLTKSINGASEYLFDILARARDASGFIASVQGMYVTRSGGGLPVRAGMTLLIMLAVVGITTGIFLATRPRAAEITSVAFAPTEPLMFVQQDVSLSWTAENVTEVYLANADALMSAGNAASTLSAVKNTAPDPANGNLVFSTVLTQPVTQFELVAVGNDGQEIRRTIDVTARLPVGVTNVTAEVRRGPGTNYNLLGMVEPGVEVLMDRRSNDGQWVRVVMGEDRGWVPSSAVTPRDLADVTQLMVLAAQEVPPTSTPVPLTSTPTPSITPTVTPTFTPSATPTNTPSVTPTATPTVNPRQIVMLELGTNHP